MSGMQITYCLLILPFDFLRTMIQNMIKEGKIVPSEVTIKLLQRAMEESHNDKFLIDGFPRNEENRAAFEAVVSHFPLFSEHGSFKIKFHSIQLIVEVVVQSKLVVPFHLTQQYISLMFCRQALNHLLSCSLIVMRKRWRGAC